MNMDEGKYWFRRGASGLGHFPQTWQGWLSLVGFAGVLATTVLVLQARLGDSTRAQSVVLLVAAVEIMAFMGFVRRRSRTRSKQ
jgi:hypothetical protein